MRVYDADVDAGGSLGGGRGARQFIRELVTGLGGPNASAKRMRLIAWIKLTLVLPLILLPTGLAILEQMPKAAHPEATHYAATVWFACLGAIVLSNLVTVIAYARAASEERAPARLIRSMLYITIAAEIASNQATNYGVGVFTSSNALYAIAIFTAYRVSLDYNAALFTLLLGVALFAGVGIAQIHFGLPPHPGLQAFVHPLDGNVGNAWAAMNGIIMAMVLSFFIVNYGMNQSLKLHRYITESVLRRYLPPSLVDRAARGELRLDAEPERRELTIMFIDLVGFTRLSDRLGAEEVGRLLNRYLSDVADLAHRRGATIDKFVGDAVMIVFGAPDPMEPELQARRCVALALEIQAHVLTLSAEHELSARIGINTGEAVVGNFGSAARSDYTVIGPTVNVAARLESRAPRGGVLIGERTAELLDGAVPLGPGEELSLRGVPRPVRAFVVTAASAQAPA